MYIKLILLMLFSLCFIACDDNSQNNLKNKIQGNTMSAPFIIKAGMSSQEYNQRNSTFINKKIDKQPAGLNFYEQSWSVSEYGLVQVEHSDKSFRIPFVLSSTGIEDTEFSERGIDEFTVQASITGNEFIEHEQARTQFMKMIQDIIALGWQPYHEFHSDPRLMGKQSFQYAIKDGSYSPDPMYMPGLDEWMALEAGRSWALYHGDVFLNVSFRRNRKFMDKDGPGVYLLTFKLMTRDALARDYFEGSEREQWKNLWSESIKKYKVMRYQEEVELIKQGYHINTQYLDPQIHTNDPVEPDDVDDLLDFIKQYNN